MSNTVLQIILDAVECDEPISSLNYFDVHDMLDTIEPLETITNEHCNYNAVYKIIKLNNGVYIKYLAAKENLDEERYYQTIGIEITEDKLIQVYPKEIVTYSTVYKEVPF